ncbi:MULTISPECIES: hypothetical protein [Streptomyces]|uniref:LPXTG-domain-containing protein cell wall anchor domain protein n=1 Tax=Streptomyces sp. CMC78 TaxID=3231512 RepID=A0AB33KFV1_9ACTN|nr:MULTISPECIES: hypothetical protein [unclassified Streptomyces]MDX5576625.1 hypothetical protein [Streptomyces sp. ID01-9D]WKN16984.1 hypothetical protein NEH83_24085 [Streptomyces sp. JUS-F4]WTC87494.1 hypothetical protein OH733_12350 [Streptomyces griseus]WTD69883.1 hypothetical protein OH763_24635 [Streptomyces griseus]
MSVARRTLLTATAAGTLLAALWFVPSANATGDTGENRPQSAPAAPADRAAAGAADDASDARLADTGAGPETTPYLVGGTALLGLGTAFVTYSVRRSVTGARPAL